MSNAAIGNIGSRSFTSGAVTEQFMNNTNVLQNQTPILNPQAVSRLQATNQLRQQYDDYVINMSAILDALKRDVAGKVNNYMVSYFCERMDCYIYMGVNLAPKLEESKNKQEETNVDKSIKDARGSTERVTDMLILTEQSAQSPSVQEPAYEI